MLLQCCRTQFGRALGEDVAGSCHGGHARVLRAQLGRGPVCAVGSKPQAPSPETQRMRGRVTTRREQNGGGTL